MRRLIPFVAGIAAVAGFAACSVDESDFKSDAEDFIEEDEGDVEDQLGVALEGATCADPASTDTGTTFTCTASGTDGVTYEFVVEITGDSSYEVDLAGPSGSTPAGTTPPTTTG